jgi:hypothetical protein
MALGVRQDTPAALAGTDGDYMPPILAADGALWIRNAVMKENFSDSTDGQPIQIAATSTPGTDIHDTTASQFDQITIDLTNTSDIAEEVTIEFGGTGAGNQVKVTVPAQDTMRAVDKAVIGGSVTVRTIAIFATTTNVINAFGFVERNV